ncbi:penicillin amidase [Chloropicon primus]|nr:penicillin amidase [Chloropicon primus]
MGKADRKRGSDGGKALDGPKQKRTRSSIKTLLFENFALPVVRNVVVPRLAKAALLDHDVTPEGAVPGIPNEVKVATEGLKEDAEILRDQYGVPHIYAKNNEDLFFLQGKVHTEDRLFQMELTRRLYSGTLSEFAGEKALAIDQFARTMGWCRVAEREVDALRKGGKKEKEVLKMLESYVAGVNATISDLVKGKKLPWEISLLKIDVLAPWGPEEVIGIMHVLAFKLSFGFQGPIIKQALVQAMGEEIANKWFASNTIPENTSPTVPRFHPDAAELLSKMAAAGAGDFPEVLKTGLGSNAWSIGPEHTDVGTLLANDPHLDTGIPTFFYESHLCSKTQGGPKDEGLHFAGMSVPGIAGMVLPGHNESVAWGVTLSMCDVEDVYVEMLSKDDPDERLGFSPFYMDKKKKKKMDVYEHVIKVKGRSEAVTFHSASTHRGPIISRLDGELRRGIEGVGEAGRGYEISFAARHLHADLYKNLTAFLGILRSENCGAARKNFSQLISPSLNICMADASGNIAYQTAGEIPRRTTPPGSETLPLPGWTGEASWRGMVRGDDLPCALNPKEGRVVTANHKIMSSDYPHYLGDLWQDGFRAKTIHRCLDRYTKVTVNDCQDVQGCSESLDAGLEFVSHFKDMKFKDAAVRNAIKLMNRWDGNLSIDSVGASIYKTIYGFSVKLLFEAFLSASSSDRPEDKTFFENTLRGLGFSSMQKAFSECKSIITGNVLRLLRTEDETVQNPVKRKLLEDAAVAAVAYLRKAYGNDMKQWRWGKLHKLKLHHPLAAMLHMGDRLNIEFEHPGDTTTPNQATYDISLNADGEPCFDIVKSSGAVAACRVVFVPSNWDASKSCVTVGQSGKYLSRHYGDQQRLFERNRGKPMAWTRAKVEKTCIFKANLIAKRA